MNFPRFLERQAANPFIKGFRREFSAVADGVLHGSVFQENVKRLAGTGLTFDICVPRRGISKAFALVDRATDVQFVLDHCGVPFGGDSVHSWREQMTEIAKRPNVIGKILGVITYIDPDGWTLDTIRPYVEHMIESFGWDRVVWGRDWPVCTLGGGVSTWVAATQALIAGASTDEKNKLLSCNARRLWGSLSWIRRIRTFLQKRLLRSRTISPRIVVGKKRLSSAGETNA